jgi:hypothetical protein
MSKRSELAEQSEAETAIVPASLVTAEALIEKIDADTPVEQLTILFGQILRRGLAESRLKGRILKLLQAKVPHGNKKGAKKDGLAPYQQVLQQYGIEKRKAQRWMQVDEDWDLVFSGENASI